MSLINEKRVSNADIVAAINNAQPQSTNFEILESLAAVRITDDPNAKEIRISEDELYKNVFTERYGDVTKTAKIRFADFKLGKEFNKLMKRLKKDPSLCKTKYLDPYNPKSSKKDWYSKKMYEELAKHYQLNKDLTSQ